MKDFKISIHGNEYTVSVNQTSDSSASVTVNGTDYDVNVEGLKSKPKNRAAVARTVRAAAPVAEAAPAAAPRAAAPAGAGTAVKSPLPGTILDVAVRQGDTVKAGQRLLLLEAMKMENNIDAECDGTVLSVNVRQGDSVLEGDVLVTIG